MHAQIGSITDGYSRSPEQRRLTGLANIGAEGTLSVFPGNVPVDSATRITPENNGKIRPSQDRENAFVRASGGGGATAIEPPPGQIIEFNAFFVAQGLARTVRGGSEG
jgi:hypothetical protein